MEAKISKLNSPKPVHGTQEWSFCTKNLQVGCEHNCKGCFAKAMAIRFGRSTPTSWAHPVINKAAVDKHYGKINGTVMSPSSHDITEYNLNSCLVVFNKILKAGNNLLIVSKPHLPVIKALCKNLEPYKKQVLFRFTITSSSDKVLCYWEPGAPAYKERLAALEFAYKAGFKTSVSCEPLLDMDPAPIIKATRGFVTDFIWLGTFNRLRQILSLTCPGDIEAKAMADQLLAVQSDAWVHDLYAKYKNDPKIKWKDSLKKVLNLERPTEKGLDI